MSGGGPGTVNLGCGGGGWPNPMDVSQTQVVVMSTCQTSQTDQAGPNGPFG